MQILRFELPSLSRASKGSILVFHHYASRVHTEVQCLSLTNRNPSCSPASIGHGHQQAAAAGSIRTGDRTSDTASLSWRAIGFSGFASHYLSGMLRTLSVCTGWNVVKKSSRLRHRGSQRSRNGTIGHREGSTGTGAGKKSVNCVAEDAVTQASRNGIEDCVFSSAATGNILVDEKPSSEKQRDDEIPAEDAKFLVSLRTRSSGGSTRFCIRFARGSICFTFGHGEARSLYGTESTKVQWRSFSQLAGQKSVEENKACRDVGAQGIVETKGENSSAADGHASNKELMNLWYNEQELVTSDAKDLNILDTTRSESALFAESFINSEVQETRDYIEASENQREGSVALSLNDLLHSLNSLEKSDDLYAKLSPFSGKISTQDATTVMKLLDDKRLCFSFYTWVKQHGSYSPDLSFFLTVVRFLLQTSEWEKLVHVTQDLFDAGFTLDNGTYCRFIKHASSKNKITICEWWFQKMKERGCWPDTVTYNMMILAYALARLPEKAFATFEEMIERGIHPDICTFCQLLLACQRKGDAELAHNYFLQIGNYGLVPDLVAYSILLDTYGKQGKATEAGEVFKEMQKAGITPDATACNSLLYAYGKAGMMDQATSTFNEYQKEAGEHPDKIVFWTMLHLYSQAGLLQRALSVKRMMRVAQIPVDASCYTNLIDGFRRKEQWEDAIRGFKEMQRYKYPVDAETYEMMMKIYTKVGHHVECERIFDQLMRKGHTKKILLYEIMINIYKRTNNLTNATRIYELTKRNGCQPNRNICNTMIHIYAKAGMLVACEKIVREMQAAGIKPNKDTFLSLIKAYAVYGQYESARDVYIVMRETGLQPDYDVAELMVEVFVKIGQVEEAQNVLKEVVDAGTKPSKRMVATVVDAGGVAVVPSGSSL